MNKDYKEIIKILDDIRGNTRFIMYSLSFIIGILFSIAALIK